MEKEFEGMEKVSVRRKWPHEALDFTPWLAENLDLLGKNLGLTLKLVQREKQVGPLSLDILANEVDKSVLVAIENQLEWTDVGHLGQLITYATVCDARVAIWVAPEFGYEFAEALNRLNEWTREGVDFYGAKIEVYENAGNSCLKPRFRRVVSPDGWNKDLTLPRVPPMPEHKEKYYRFYRPLIEELVGVGVFDKPVLYSGHIGRLFRSRIHRCIGYSVSLEKDKDAWVTLEIRTDNIDHTNHIFNILSNNRKDIERSIDAGPNAEWAWCKHDLRYFSTINIRKDGSIDDCEAMQQETRAWMHKHLVKFKEYFDDRLNDLVSGQALGELE